jgi:hypothetical protein
MEDLTQAQHKAAAALYQQSSAGGPGAAGGEGPAGDSGEAGGSSTSGQAKSGDVIDAEVVDDKS